MAHDEMGANKQLDSLAELLCMLNLSHLGLVVVAQATVKQLDYLVFAHAAEDFELLEIADMHLMVLTK